MKKLMTLLSVLAIVGMSLPAMAQEVNKTVLFFRSITDPNVEPDMDVCARGLEVLPDVPGWNMVLGASAWGVATALNNGEVVREKVRQIGTATACYYITDLTFTPFQAESPFYFEGEMTRGLRVAAAGECENTYNAYPEGGPVFSSCYAEVIPDNSTPGIKWGQATGNATAVLMGEIPGFESGSFWTIQLVWE